MLKTCILYGSTTRYTEMVAIKIAETLGFEQAELIDIEDFDLKNIENYDFIIAGIPTWDYGEVQFSWQQIWDELETVELSDKIFALFGLGDQFGYSEWFVDALGMLHQKLEDRGAIIIGEWPVEGYKFNTQKSLTADGMHFVGLALDEVNQPDLTDERIFLWCKKLKEYIF